MNSSLKGFTLLAILVAAAGAYPAFGQAYLAGNTTGTTTPASTVQPITVMTDKASYNSGDKITISGTTKDYISGMPISVIIKNPIGNLVLLAQVDLGTDKTYSRTVTAGGSLWYAPGTYEIDVQFGSQDRSAKTTFQFSGQVAPPPTCPAGQFLVNGTCSTVPEFGPLAMVVLVVAIISIIAVSAKTGLRIK